MVSTRTESRKRKVAILREIMNDVLALLLLEHKQRDRVKLSEFRKTRNKVKNVLKAAEKTEKTGK